MECYNMQESGKRIQMLRKSRGLTQSAFAEQIGVSLSMVKKIENGTKGISIDLLIVISAYLNVSFESIILGHSTSYSPSFDCDRTKNQLMHLSEELLAIISELEVTPKV